MSAKVTKIEIVMEYTIERVVIGIGLSMMSDPKTNSNANIGIRGASPKIA